MKISMTKELEQDIRDYYKDKAISVAEQIVDMIKDDEGELDISLVELMENIGTCGNAAIKDMVDDPFNPDVYDEACTDMSTIINLAIMADFVVRYRATAYRQYFEGLGNDGTEQSDQEGSEGHSGDAGVSGNAGTPAGLGESIRGQGVGSSDEGDGGSEKAPGVPPLPEAQD